jgi:hypothetical protein
MPFPKKPIEVNEDYTSIKEATSSPDFDYDQSVYTEFKDFENLDYITTPVSNAGEEMDLIILTNHTSNVTDLKPATDNYRNNIHGSIIFSIFEAILIAIFILLLLTGITIILKIIRLCNELKPTLRSPTEEDN